ncbi:hypothetical protein KUTeg_020831 [Tegillarca granosa]|uniref:Uncharacterized protein n=1 Tax=Tegillarca granosa TaxID=220873 RepID=A0ABQ9EBH9_TEGGR|nr:hypothetical protein KUTeg_020831 [Tegillarca granosa]
MSYSRRRLLRTNENIPNFLPQDVSKHQVVKKTRINSTTQAPETGNTHRPRTDKRFSDSDDLGLFSAHVDDIEDSTHSFVSLFLSSRQTPKPSTSAIMEIRSSTEPTETIYPWLNTTNIDNGDTIRDTNKKDKKTKSNKQEKEEKRKAKKESRNKHENLDSLNKKVRGTRNKWKKEQREKIKEQVQKICTGDFIGAQGKRCCQKSIKCFGDLPQLIDEIETYNNSEDQDDLQRQHMHSNQSFSDKRPLPSAPSNGPVSSDNTGYLTPRSSKDELGLINDRDSGGYHVLQKEPSRKPSVDAYEKLQNEEGEYIEPTHTRDSRVRIPSQKAPQNNTSNISKPNGDDNYHIKSEDPLKFR